MIQSIDLRDDFNYQPELIQRLNTLYALISRHRLTYASVLALAGGLFLMQWSLLADQAAGYPVLGIPVLGAAVWLTIMPTALVAKLLTWSPRLQREFLSFRDLHWMQAMTDRHPVLQPRVQPYLESPNPVPQDALRQFWPLVVREEEDRQEGGR